MLKEMRQAGVPEFFVPRTDAIICEETDAWNGVILNQQHTHAVLEEMLLDVERLPDGEERKEKKEQEAMHG